MKTNVVQCEIKIGKTRIPSPKDIGKLLEEGIGVKTEIDKLTGRLREIQDGIIEAVKPEMAKRKAGTGYALWKEIMAKVVDNDELTLPDGSVDPLKAALGDRFQDLFSAKTVYKIESKVRKILKESDKKNADYKLMAKWLETKAKRESVTFERIG